ncbi:reverse transcriptase domain-containing protein [Tanacetum coccineum]
MPPKRNSMSTTAIERLISQHVADALLDFECTTKCGNCKRIGHQTNDCRSLAAATNQRAPVGNQRTLTCFECGKQGHYRSECPELKNQNHGNQAGRSEARGKVYALGGGETYQDPSNIANNVVAKREIFFLFPVLPSET